MAFTRFTKNVLNVSALPDRVQNQAQALKATFDQSGVDIKAALNGLIAELEASTSASNLGADVPSVTTKTVQAILSAFEEEIANRYTKNEIDTLVSGNTNDLVADVDVNLTTGVITVTKKDGTVEKFDTAIEKVPAKFEIVESGTSLFLKITNVDGTSTQTDITELMNVYDFNNTNDIAFNVSGTGNEKVVTASIRPNSIGLDKLSLSVMTTLEGYMTSARDSANAAKISEANAKSSANTATKAAEKASIAEGLANTAINKATEAESYAHGGTGTREGEDTDNAKYYSQVAKEVAGGDFVTPTEMEAYAQKKGTAPSFEGEELSGEVIETDTLLDIESNLHISGNSEQDSRSGKNLLNLPDRSGGLGGGATITVANGIITLNGTTTSSGENVFDGFQVSEDGDYTFSIELSTTTSGSWAVLQESTDKSSWSALFDFNFSTLTRAGTKTLSKSKYYRLRIVANGGVTYANLTIKLQLEKGTTATEWEPYGVQPSPDYPSEIRSVKSKSDNLFPTVTAKTLNGVTCTQNSDGSLTLNGTATAQTQFDTIKTIEESGIKVGQQYTLSTNQAISGINYFVQSSNGAIWIAGQITMSSGESSKTVVITEQVATHYKFAIQVLQGTVLNNVIIKPMLNKGDKALPYQPYGYVPVEAKVEGKNLLDVPNKEITANSSALTCSIKEQSITINGTASSGNTINLVNEANSTTPIIKLEANQTYYMKMYYESGDVNNWSSDIQLRNSNGNVFKGTMNQWKNGFTYTPTENVDITWVRIYLGAYTFTKLKFKLQVSRVNLNEWVEPKPLKTISLPLGDIELRSTPDGTRDTFERVDGVWNVLAKNNVDLVNITGVITLDNGNIGSTYSTKVKKFDNSANYKDYILCNKAKNGGRNNLQEGYMYENPINIIFIGNSTDTLETMKAKYEGAELLYRLDTPTYTPITDETLIQALDQLESLILHKGYNRITVTSVNGVKAYLDLSIPPTASVTNVVETESSQDMIVPVLSDTGDVKVKIPKENKMTLNPTTGVVKVNGKNVATEEYIDEKLTEKANVSHTHEASDIKAGTLATGMACATPTASTHIANKSYVDSKKTKVTTGTFTGSPNIQTISLGFTPDLVLIYTDYNNNHFVDNQDTEAKYRNVPRILTSAFLDDENGCIVSNGFTHMANKGGQATHYIAIKF